MKPVPPRIRIVLAVALVARAAGAAALAAAQAPICSTSRRVVTGGSPALQRNDRLTHGVVSGALVHLLRARRHRNLKTAGPLVKSDLTRGAGLRCDRGSPCGVAEQPHRLLLRRECHGGDKPIRLIVEGGDAFAAVRDELAFIAEQRYARARYRSHDKIRRSIRSENERECVCRRQSPRGPVSYVVYIDLARHSHLSGCEREAQPVEPAAVTEDIAGSQRAVIGVR